MNVNELIKLWLKLKIIDIIVGTMLTLGFVAIILILIK